MFLTEPGEADDSACNRGNVFGLRGALANVLSSHQPRPKSGHIVSSIDQPTATRSGHGRGREAERYSVRSHGSAEDGVHCMTSSQGSFETKLPRVQCCQRLTKRRSNCNAVWSDRLRRGDFGSNVRKPDEILDDLEGSTSESYREVNDGEGAVIVELIQRLSSGEIDGQRDAVKELRFLAKESPDKKILIARAGSIPMLVDLLSTRDPETREHAVTTLLNLSLINANKEAIVHAGAIDAIVEVLRSGSMEARENAAALLFSLSVLDENKVTIGQSGALSPLVDLCRDGTMRARTDAASALFNLSLYEENKPKLVSAGIVPPLVQLLGDPTAWGSRVVDVALAILSLIAPHKDCTAAVGDASAIPVLLDIMKSGSPGNKENAVVVLLALSESDPALAVCARQLGVWPYAAELARSGIPRCRKKASHLLELLQSIEHDRH